MRTRRSVLASGATGLAVGGCLGGHEEVASEGADEPADVGDPVPRGPVELAHWGWADREIATREVIADALPSSFDLALDTHPDREALETSVADRMGKGNPPETFQTVTGDELARYVVAVTLYDLRDVASGEMVRRYRPGVEESVHHRAAPYAVPITVECRNWLAVSVNALETAGLTAGDLATADDLPTALGRLGEDARLGLPSVHSAWFQLFCLELLATAGEAGIEEVRDGRPRIGTIAPAVEHVATLAGGDRLVLWNEWDTADDPVAATIGPIGVPDGDWIPVPWPGTAGTAAIHVTGLPFPKRARNAHGTVALLGAAASVGVQTRLAALAGALPAREDATVSFGDGSLQRQADWLAESSTTVRSPATGCGLSTDQRRRAVECFAPEVVTSTPTDEFARRLRDALS